MTRPDMSSEALAKRFPALAPAPTAKSAPAHTPTKAIPGALVEQCLRDAVPLLHEGAEDVLWSLVDRAKVLDANGNEDPVLIRSEARRVVEAHPYRVGERVIPEAVPQPPSGQPIGSGFKRHGSNALDETARRAKYPALNT